MRVTHLVPALFGPDGIIGGAERYALELARHMASEVPTTLVTFETGTGANGGPAARRDGAGIREAVVAPTRGDEGVGSLPICVVRRPWRVRGQRSNPFSLRVFEALRTADVVHCHQQHLLVSSLVALWGRATGRSVFVSDLGGGGWDLSAYVPTDTWFAGHLHLSDYSRKVHGHVENPRARVIAGGVDLDRFYPDAATARTDEVLFVGRVLPHKGVHHLIRGLPQDMRLRIVGPMLDERTAADLRRLAEGKAVVFEGPIGEGALIEAYRRALCVVLPSVYEAPDGTYTQVPELLGQTLLEGMACETPAVATTVASLPEVVRHGVTGLLVPPGDAEAIGHALRTLRDDPPRARAMGRAGRAHVRAQFSWDGVVRRCLAAYRDEPEIDTREPQHEATRRPAPRRVAPQEPGRWARALRLVVTGLLLAGFARAAGTIGGHHLRLWRAVALGASEAPRTGARASTEWLLEHLGYRSDNDLVRAVGAGPNAGPPLDSRTEAHHAASYLAYPDPDAAAREPTALEP